ncbi:MAG: hypothetical protein MI924_24190 [Chloroflexales bacterium]|nr:hypothetical protein [Chloroflexales bacterium]
MSCAREQGVFRYSSFCLLGPTVRPDPARRRPAGRDNPVQHRAEVRGTHDGGAPVRQDERQASAGDVLYADHKCVPSGAEARARERGVCARAARDAAGAAPWGARWHHRGTHADSWSAVRPGRATDVAGGL